MKLARQKLQAREGREPTLQEIMAETGLSSEDAVMAMEASIEVESIYSAVYQDDGSEVYLVDKVVRGANSSVGSSMVGVFDSEDTEKEQLLNHMLLKQLLETLEVQVSRLEKKILLRLRERAGT